MYLRYPDAFLPSCWLWHPPLIEELRWLRATHREAYHPNAAPGRTSGTGTTATAPASPAASGPRTDPASYANTPNDGHQRLPAPQVPLTDAVELTARAWTSMPDTPLIPTELQVRRAEQHDDARHRQGA